MCSFLFQMIRASSSNKQLLSKHNPYSQKKLQMIFIKHTKNPIVQTINKILLIQITKNPSTNLKEYPLIFRILSMNVLSIAQYQQIIVDYRMKEKELFNYHFLAIALLAFLNCPDRSDFNLPLSILIFVIWNHKPYTQKHRILWIIIASIICDLIWILGISVGQWNENRQGNQLRGLTQALSVVNLCYKAILFVYAVVSMESCQKFFTLEAFRKNVLYFQ